MLLPSREVRSKPQSYHTRLEMLHDNRIMDIYIKHIHKNKCLYTLYTLPYILQNE